LYVGISQQTKMYKNGSRLLHDLTPFHQHDAE
jgi:hypothetical protein